MAFWSQHAHGLLVLFTFVLPPLQSAVAPLCCTHPNNAAAPTHMHVALMLQIEPVQPPTRRLPKTRSVSPCRAPIPTPMQQAEQNGSEGDTAAPATAPRKPKRRHAVALDVSKAADATAQPPMLTPLATVGSPALPPKSFTLPLLESGGSNGVGAMFVVKLGQGQKKGENGRLAKPLFPSTASYSTATAAAPPPLPASPAAFLPSPSCPSPPSTATAPSPPPQSPSPSSASASTLPSLQSQPGEDGEAMGPEQERGEQPRSSSSPGPRSSSRSPGQHGEPHGCVWQPFLLPKNGLHF